MALSKKQRAFVEHYLQCWNGAEAARKAGYSERSARSTASRLLTYDNIQSEIGRKLDKLKMSADEVVRRLADMARADMGDFIVTDDDGEYYVSLKRAREENKTHLIKKLKKIRHRDGRTDYEIELHDPQAALDKLARHYGVYEKDNRQVVEHEFGGEVGDVLKSKLAAIADNRKAKPADRQSDNE